MITKVFFSDIRNNFDTISVLIIYFILVLFLVQSLVEENYCSKVLLP
jgi:hypothetical protein